MRIVIFRSLLILPEEATPLKISDVKKNGWTDREHKSSASTILAIKRANRAFPVIEPILKKNEFG
jgi:hypothetical protein